MNEDNRWADPVRLGRALAALRNSLNWTQARLAKEANIPASAVSLYEGGQKLPEIPSLFKLLEAMGYGLCDLDAADNFLIGLQRKREGRGGSTESPAPPDEPWPSGTAGSQATSDRVRAAAAEAGYPMPEDRGRALELWERLKGYGHGARLALVAETREFQVWALSELISHESVDAAPENPAEALNLAHLALEIAGRLPGGRERRLRSQGYARHHLGNALRVQGQLTAARDVFVRAEEEWKAGEGCPGDLLRESQLLDLKASFLTADRRLPEAIAVLDRALSIGELGMKGRLLINKAKAVEEQDDLEKAIVLLKEAQPFVDEQREPRLWLCLRHNLLDFQSKLGRFLEAEALIPEVRRLSQSLGKELDHVRLEWSEGRIDAGLGRTQEGIDRLSRVRAEFVNRKIWYDAALVTLELTTVFLKEGQTAMVKTLAAHLKPIFQAQGVHREALAALTLFSKAAETEKATLTLAENLVTYLRRARHDPKLKFETSRG